MKYNSLKFVLQPYTEEYAEILIALLDSFNFEGIEEAEDHILAYVAKENYREDVLGGCIGTLKELGCKLNFTQSELEEKNWNSEWESNFQPVVLNEQCVIRAPFHPDFSDYQYRITIEPKMSFGTGHHHTTRLMVEQILRTDVKDKLILDMGCGTGVLGILAAMRGAKEIVAIDNDEWAWENTIENAGRNRISNLNALLGGKERIPDAQFDVILANINRNILMDQAPDYALHCKKGGSLFLSGILIEDQEKIEQCFRLNNFEFISSEESNNWTMMLFKRK